MILRRRNRGNRMGTADEQAFDAILAEVQRPAR
jgi:hypothetical protein